MITLPVYLFIFIELLLVAWGDFKTRKISNYWSILNLIIFAIVAFIFPETYKIHHDIFIYSGLFLFVGFALFVMKVMGGGDAKFLSTFILIVPYSLHDKYLNYLLIGTVIVASILFMKNVIKNFKFLIEKLKVFDFEAVKSCFGSKFAFAPVILLAWILIGLDLKKII